MPPLPPTIATTSLPTTELSPSRPSTLTQHLWWALPGAQHRDPGAGGGPLGPLWVAPDLRRAIWLGIPTASTVAYRLDLTSPPSLLAWHWLPDMLSPRGCFACTPFLGGDGCGGGIIITGDGSWHFMFPSEGSWMSSVEWFDVDSKECLLPLAPTASFPPSSSETLLGRNSSSRSPPCPEPLSPGMVTVMIASGGVMPNIHNLFAPKEGRHRLFHVHCRPTDRGLHPSSTVQAFNAIPIHILIRHADKLFSILFMASIYFLMCRWREKI